MIFKHIGSVLINRKVKFLFLVTISIYFLAGVFPLSVFETDSLAIANDCQHIINTGIFKASVIGHSFDMQSGTYFLIVSFSKLFHASTITVYSILSTLFAISFFVLIVLFIKKLFGYSCFLIITTLFLFQEITSLSYYPNSTSIAAAFWMAGFIILTKYPNFSGIILSGLFLTFSAWFRIDILFVFPSVLPLLLIITRDIKKSILHSLILLLIVVPGVLLLMSFSNAEVSGFLGYTKDHGTLFSMTNNLGTLDLSLFRAHIAYFSLLLFFLISIGVYYLFKHKEFLIIVFILAGVAFYYLLGINNTVAPKHLAPFTPFWLLAALYAIDNIMHLDKAKNVLVSTLVFLFILQYIIGFKADIATVPYANKEYSLLNPEPSFIKLFNSGNLGGKVVNVEARIGSGTKVPSSDEILLSSGILFNPLSYRSMKLKTFRSNRSLEYYIDTCTLSDLNILISDGSSQVVVNVLMNKEYYWQEDSVTWKDHLDFYRKPDDTIKLIRKNGFVKDNSSSFQENFKSMPEGRFLAVFLWDWQTYMMNERIKEKAKISDGVYEISN